jgi:hypothetical protein
MNLQLDKIKDIAEGVVEQYRQLLDSENINASHTLSNTATVMVELNGTKLSISLMLQPYWKYIEHGRRAGKFPPIDNIEQWIKVKPVIPDARTGRIPTTRQLAFLISRKIATQGIEPKSALNRAMHTSAVDDIISQIKIEIIKQMKQELLK